MKKLTEKTMTQTTGGGYCEDVLTIWGGAIATGNIPLAFQAATLYGMYCR